MQFPSGGIHPEQLPMLPRTLGVSVRIGGQVRRRRGVEERVRTGLGEPAQALANCHGGHAKVIYQVSDTIPVTAEVWGQHDLVDNRRRTDWQFEVADAVGPCQGLKRLCSPLLND